MRTNTAIEITPQTAEKGIITRNATLQVYTPKPHFKGGSVKWYKDKPKAKN